MLSEFLPNKYQSLHPVKHQSLSRSSIKAYSHSSISTCSHMIIRSCFQMRISAYSHSSISAYSHSSITACPQSTVRSSSRYRRHNRRTLCTCHTTLARVAAPGQAFRLWGCLRAAAGRSPPRPAAEYRNGRSSSFPAG